MANSLVSNALWSASDMVHGKNSAALPVSLLLVASCLVFYRHMTVESYGPDLLKTCLGLHVIQMLPLVFLEVKILSCVDPVGLLCKFGSHVILMHTSFLALRVGSSCFLEVGGFDTTYQNVAHIIVGLVALHKGFGLRLSLKTCLQHYDVFCLSLLALVAAYSQEYLSELLRPDDWFHANLIQRSLVAASDYIEILAFVPAVWMVHKEDKNAPRVTVENTVTKRKTVAFFAFLLVFYVTEDVLTAPALSSGLALIALAHYTHFLLLLDLSFFILAHIFNPEKLLDIKTLFLDTINGFNGV